MKQPLDALRQHVLDLCERHGVMIEWCRKQHLHGSAKPRSRKIHIPEILSTLHYSTALHELGHILGRHQDSRHAIVRERWAWAWARANALMFTSAMEHDAQFALSTYETEPRRKRPNGPVVLTRCVDCGFGTNTGGEWYMVRNEVWEQAWRGRRKSWHALPGQEILCIGCLEARIGRKLTRSDFTHASINDGSISERLRNRLSDHGERDQGQEESE